MKSYDDSQPASWIEVPAAVGDRLGMPSAEPGFDPMASKRGHVRNRLARVPLDELKEIARRVVEEFPDDSADLDQLLSGSGFRGPDGELRNIIFAADGPKPRIVLRDAISHTIESCCSRATVRGMPRARRTCRR